MLKLWLEGEISREEVVRGDCKIGRITSKTMFILGQKIRILEHNFNFILGWVLRKVSPMCLSVASLIRVAAESKWNLESRVISHLALIEKSNMQRFIEPSRNVAAAV